MNWMINLSLTLMLPTLKSSLNRWPERVSSSERCVSSLDTMCYYQLFYGINCVLDGMRLLRLFVPKTCSQSEIQKLPNRDRKLIIQIFRDKFVWDESSYSQFNSFSQLINNIAIEIHVVKFKSVWSCSSKETNTCMNQKRESISNCGHRELIEHVFHGLS